MELILATLGAGPIGCFSPTRRRALTIYWVFNALILGAGIGLNRLGTALAERRQTKLGAAGAA